MKMDDVREPKILLGITTYAGDFEQRLILKKVLKHLRKTNGARVDVLLVSDGRITDPEVIAAVDFLIDRPGPSGLHQGELDSINEIVHFARENDYQIIVKSAGDIIMSAPDWALKVVQTFRQSGKRMMSTHWFEDDSWVVGTKFFAADTDFLEEVLPVTLGNTILEEAVTRSIATRYKSSEVLYLINSETGERHEVKAELKAWGWEHAHRLSKFAEIDAFQPLSVRWFNRCILSQLLRVKRDLQRSVTKLLSKHRKEL